MFQVIYLLGFIFLLLTPLGCGASGEREGGNDGGNLLIVTRQSVSSTGSESDAGSSNAVVDATGTLVFFDSNAGNLVLGDNNARRDIFMRDTQTGQTTRLSLGPGGVQANGDSSFPSVSQDGLFVAFESLASNLVLGDTNGSTDLLVRDRRNDQTIRVSVTSAGVQGNGTSFGASISSDGRLVAYVSQAFNLVPGDTNATFDIFVHDRDADVDGIFDEAGAINTTRVNVGPGGVEADAQSLAPAISGNGRFVAFESDASNLVLGDTNGLRDVFVRDRQAGVTTRVSVGPGGIQSDGDSFFPSISSDGRFVAFESDASNLVLGDNNAFTDIFVYDRDSDGNGTFDEPGGFTTTRVSVNSAGFDSNDISSIGSRIFGGNAAISGDGRFVVFLSDATNLVLGDNNLATDVFVRDLVTGTTTRMSRSSSGVQANANSNQASINLDGTVIAFSSDATNLVLGDTNASEDVFTVEVPLLP